jgi:hypothetical protein
MGDLYLSLSLSGLSGLSRISKAERMNKQQMPNYLLEDDRQVLSSSRQNNSGSVFCAL